MSADRIPLIWLADSRSMVADRRPHVETLKGTMSSCDYSPVGRFRVFLRPFGLVPLALAAAATLASTNDAVAQARLKVGDSAPPLAIKTWIKGEPVNPADTANGHVYVIEFWATWCGPCVMGIPHMSEMQDRFRPRGVTFVGVSTEAEQTVRKFLERGYESRMRYTVAIDDGGKSDRAWMQASGQQGIPCAFVVQNGKVQWIGHPMDGLDVKVAELCGDKAFAEEKKKFDGLQRQWMAAIQAEDFATAITHLDEMLKIKPDDASLLLARYHMLLVKLDRAADASKHGRAVADRLEREDALNAFAWVLLTHPDFENRRDLELAKTVAQKAVRLSRENNPNALDTYALALFMSGDTAGAVNWQKKAIAKCDPEDKGTLRKLTKNLKTFEEKAGSGASKN